MYYKKIENIYIIKTKNNKICIIWKQDKIYIMEKEILTLSYTVRWSIKWLGYSIMIHINRRYN